MRDNGTDRWVDDGFTRVPSCVDEIRGGTMLGLDIMGECAHENTAVKDLCCVRKMLGELHSWNDCVDRIVV